MSPVNRRIVLASRPTEAASTDNFRLERVPVPEPGDGQVLIRHHFLSLDPYMRGRMSDAKSYAAPQPLNEVMIGGTVGEVIASRHPGFKDGDSVVSMGGWQEYSLADANGGALAPRKVDASRVPLSAYLGVLGMPGVTAWYGLNRICEPKPGETIAVSAATGAVGSVVGQLAKLKGCRAIGVAGGRDKCAYAVEELGLDACIDYKSAGDARALGERLAGAAPAGVDGYFENVGGMVLDAMLPQMNAFGRIAVCGMISIYDGAPLPLANPALILRSRLKLQGFIVSEHMAVWPQALGELGAALLAGKLKFRESIAEGIESAPDAFLGLLKGRNFGKQLVRLA
jgi:NADPH-dependent curcumin reductase CurA